MMKRFNLSIQILIEISPQLHYVFLYPLRQRFLLLLHLTALGEHLIGEVLDIDTYFVNHFLARLDVLGHSVRLYLNHAIEFILDRVQIVLQLIHLSLVRRKDLVLDVVYLF